METSRFDYELPNALIAQTPASPRDSCKLLVYHRILGRIEHKVFTDVIDYLNPGDVLVVNDSKVIPARLFGKKKTGGKVEVLLLHSQQKGMTKNVWTSLTKPGLQPGDQILFNDNFFATVTARENEQALVEFNLSGNEFWTAIEQVGHTPLPPYISPTESKPQDYQTVFAREAGSAAAPTAGLHFTPELLERIKAKGVIIAPVTLHVGLGTFQPISTDTIEEHQIHSEYATISKETLQTIARAKSVGNKIIAVGTTATRALEGLAAPVLPACMCGDYVNGVSGWVSIYITPGYKYRVVDRLITNFHLPKSSLLVLLSAMIGDEWKRIYDEAIAHDYRFYSFGDAMMSV